MTTRRSLLVGFALPAALNACHPIVPAAFPRHAEKDHPDAALLAFGPVISGLIAVADKAHRDASAAQELVWEMTGPRPVKPKDIQLYPTDAAYHAAKRRFDEDCCVVATRSMQIEKSIGFNELEDAADNAEGAVVEACERLAAMRATTLDGLALKARLAERGNWDDLSRSIVDDLLAMTGDVA